MKQTQLLKGVLEGCVLLIVAEEEVYGYEMVQRLKEFGFTEIVGGTVYPLLQKLEKNGHLTSVFRPSPEGPDRKYYCITQEGMDYTKKFVQQWEQLVRNVQNIIAVKEEFLDE